MGRGGLVAMTPDHVAKNALRVTVVGSLGTEGRKSRGKKLDV